MRRILFSYLLGLLIFSACHSTVDDIALSSLQWTVKQRGVDDALHATVPGSIHTDLYAAGRIPDMYFGSNEDSVQWIDKETWEYETSFGLSSAQLRHRYIYLQFDGLDTYAQVYLNGQLVLESDNMFRQWELDAKPYLIKGKNELKVVFEPVWERIEAAGQALPYTLPEGHRMHVRKAAYHFGWDWGPTFVTAGIWKEGRLRFLDGPHFRDVHLQLSELNPDEATYQVEVLLNNPSLEEVFVEVEIRLDTLIQEFEMTMPVVAIKQYHGSNPGFELWETEMRIPDPQLWWTHDLGEQTLYDVELRLRDKKGGKLYDQKHFRMGIRQIELVQEPDSIGQSFYFKLNGLPIFARGANYIPADYFPHRSPLKMENVLLDAKELNMNMLRVWGGGIYEDERFYELCDELGLLVWQDFMFANTMYPGDEDFLSNVEQEVREQVRRLRHHPSIALWCGNNEISEGWYNWGWQRQFGYSKADSTQIYSDYLRLFEDLIPSLLAEEDPSRPYHPTSPATGWGRKESLLQGDIHYWGVWWGMEPFEKYEEKIGRFHSEHGFQALPMMPSLRRFVPEEELYLSSAAMRSHQKHPTGYETIKTYMAREYPVPEDLESFAYVSQLMQANGLSLATRTHRLAKPYTMGSLYWQLNDVWPVTSWSTMDYYGKPKASHHHLKSDFAPLMLQLRMLDGQDEAEVWIVSDKRDTVEMKLQFALMDFKGELLASDERIVKIDPMSAKVYSHLPVYPKEERKDSFVVLQLWAEDDLHAEYMHFWDKPKDLPLRQVFQSARWVDNTTIELSTSLGVAMAVYLEAGDYIMEDNWFHAAPGTTRLRVYKDPQDDARPKITVRNLNELLLRD